jgi:hypothetical protein
LTPVIAESCCCEEAIHIGGGKSESAMAKLFYRKTRRGASSTRRRARVVSHVDDVTVPDSATPRTENDGEQGVVDATPDALAAPRKAESIEPQKEESNGSQQQP